MSDYGDSYTSFFMFHGKNVFGNDQNIVPMENKGIRSFPKGIHACLFAFVEGVALLHYSNLRLQEID